LPELAFYPRRPFAGRNVAALSPNACTTRSACSYVVAGGLRRRPLAELAAVPLVRKLAGGILSHVLTKPFLMDQICASVVTNVTSSTEEVRQRLAADARRVAPGYARAGTRRTCRRGEHDHTTPAAVGRMNESLTRCRCRQVCRPFRAGVELLADTCSLRARLSQHGCANTPSRCKSRAAASSRSSAAR
jgi:hypothetical protein